MRVLLIILLLTVGVIFSSHGQNIDDKKIDSVTEVNDTIIKKPKKKTNLLPIAIPITEPAVGIGIVLSGLYFVPNKDTTETQDLAVLAAGYTSNKSWLAGGQYQGYWKHDHIRYTGTIGYGVANLEYYAFGEKPINFQQRFAIIMQQLLFRLGDSNFFLGGNLKFSKVTIPIVLGDFDFDDFEFYNNGISAVVQYDDLDNYLSPTDGKKIHLGYTQFMEVLGTKRNWGKMSFYAWYYKTISEKWIPGYRFESFYATGKPPFYAKPYIRMRGIPALRYQGNLTALLETEQLYHFKPRWGALVFAGVGGVFEAANEEIQNEFVWAFGFGGRYLALKSMGVKLGIDIARGPEEWAYYATVGKAW
ncbi:hypothetical protein [Namhaeicola litoreus]|uniref:Bacterial surface antigen (D15) domain-containing protein n=1 Tax=Namhaeicola litoreus TaxID=1052145 RepID=A0ABW3Y3Z0_9FLAO